MEDGADLRQTISTCESDLISEPFHSLYLPVLLSVCALVFQIEFIETYRKSRWKVLTESNTLFSAIERHRSEI